MIPLAKMFSTVCGAGYFPVAPGTFASLLAALLYHFVLARFAPLPYVLLVFGIFVGGTWASMSYARAIQKKDPRRIVVDEVAGQLVALFLSPAGWTWTVAGFFLFRLFDIVKPFPIRRLERLPGGWGIMADDILAGAYAAALIHLFLWVR